VQQFLHAFISDHAAWPKFIWNEWDSSKHWLLYRCCAVFFVIHGKQHVTTYCRTNQCLYQTVNCNFLNLKSWSGQRVR
jgi:hypothetical protein